MKKGIRLVQTGTAGIGFEDKPDNKRFICKNLRNLDVNGLILEFDYLSLVDPIGRACIVPNYVGKCITAVIVRY